jgi:hypothetical protein
MLSASIAVRSLRRQALDLSWIVATGEDEFNHDPFAGNTRLCENRTAACDRAHYDTGADVLLCDLNGKRMAAW